MSEFCSCVAIFSLQLSQLGHRNVHRVKKLFSHQKQFMCHRDIDFLKGGVSEKDYRTSSPAACVRNDRSFGLLVSLHRMVPTSRAATGVARVSSTANVLWLARDPRRRSYPLPSSDLMILIATSWIRYLAGGIAPWAYCSLHFSHPYVFRVRRIVCPGRRH